MQMDRLIAVLAICAFAILSTNQMQSLARICTIPNPIIAIIAIIAKALTKACPKRYHTLASDSTRGRRDLPFDRGALPKRYVGSLGRSLARRSNRYTVVPTVQRLPSVGITSGCSQPSNDLRVTGLHRTCAGLFA